MRASHSTESRRTDRQTNRQTKGQTDGKCLLSMSATVNLVVRPFKAYRWLLLPRAGISSLFQFVEKMNNSLHDFVLLSESSASANLIQKALGRNA